MLRALNLEHGNIGVAVADRIDSMTDKPVGTKGVKDLSVLRNLQAQSVSTKFFTWRSSLVNQR